jgi:hypothetical protein
MRFAIISTLLAASLLVGCDNGSAPQTSPVQPDAQAQAAVAAQSAGPHASAKGTDIFRAEPESLDCRKGNKVTLHWDVRQRAGIDEIQIFVISPKGNEKLFMTKGRAGSVPTGKWVRVGTQLSLRDKKDGAELARIVVDGSACEASPGAGKAAGA